MSDRGRRRFLDGFLGATLTALAGAVIYPVARFLSPPDVPEAVANRVLAGKVAELAQKDWKIFPFGSEPGILIRTGESEYRAFSAKCTHLSCTVRFDEPSRRIWCPCHNGYFDLNGRNVAGPPPTPLEVYEIHVVGEDIFVSRG